VGESMQAAWLAAGHNSEVILTNKMVGGAMLA
jgi:hypothetical protein